jgi:hypothetical protein
MCVYVWLIMILVSIEFNLIFGFLVVKGVSDDDDEFHFLSNSSKV